MLKEFKEFAFKGSVVDLAVGVIIGAAFNAVVKAFVDNLINPLLGLLGGGKASLEALALKITPGVSLTYGQFLSAILNFLLVAFALFILVKAVSKFRRQEESADRECPYCLTAVPKKATRCPACTSELIAE
ncbi:MAG: large conductance mechanosensitive channel protein MscL [Actinobacteria bacterium]|nr:MAG: large conductance mechanosensitive channel protein MscL [Actinomycetota bacterium]